MDDIADPARLRMYLKEALDIINKDGLPGRSIDLGRFTALGRYCNK